MEDQYDIEQLINLNRQVTVLEKSDLKEKLVLMINYLLLHNFDKLIQILYRVDVSEQKLKELLQKSSHTDSAIIIADLLIERQEEKMKTKAQFPSNDIISEEDKW